MAKLGPDEILEAEFDTWLTPAEAVSALSHLPSSVAKQAILKRLANGLIASAARDLIGRRGREEERFKFWRLGSIRWQEHPPNNVDTFWMTGDWETQIADPHRMGANTKLSMHDIRLRPSDLDAVPRPRVAGETAPSPLLLADASDAFSKALVDAQRVFAVEEKPNAAGVTVERKRVSDPTLKAWWELCKTLKPASQWTRDDMRDFFDRCFPDKSVARDRLRDVSGKQKSGPKTISAE